jgi:sporadic carbohydrate cluster protein (TIGR04323 family)
MCGTYKIPIPIQSVYLRDYSARAGLPFSLPVTEYIFPGVWSGLAGIIARATSQDFILAPSIACIIELYIQRPSPTDIIRDISECQGTFIFPLERMTLAASHLRDVSLEFIANNAYRLPEGFRL